MTVSPTASGRAAAAQERVGALLQCGRDIVLRDGVDCGEPDRYE